MQSTRRGLRRELSCCVAFTWLRHGPCVVRRDFLASSLCFLRHHLTTSLQTLLATSSPSRADFTLFASTLRRRANPHICCITSTAAQCSSHANMSDPPPANKPAFSLYGDLIAPNGDSSVISSGPVKYDMKPKDTEPEAQKKKNGRVAFYISSS
jgi:hypothetical protein